MKELNQKMHEITSQDLKDRHSLFQLNYFLVGKEPTVQAKLWRCVRELKTRKETLENLAMEIEENQDKLRILELHEISEPRPELLEIKERRKERRKIAIQKTINRLEERMKGLQEECDYFISAYEALVKKEKIKPYDDIESQKEYWDKKLSQDVNLRLMFGLPLEPELLKTVLALNSDALVKKDLMGHIEKIKLQYRNQQIDAPALNSADSPFQPLQIEEKLDGSKNINT